MKNSTQQSQPDSQEQLIADNGINQESLSVRDASMGSIVIGQYHEMRDQSLEVIDPALSLKQNLDLLEDMVHRLCFVNRELRYVLKKD